MSSPEWPFEAEVRRIATLLARGEYYTLEELTQGERLSASDLAQAVRDYPGTLRDPPSWEAAPLDVVPVTVVTIPTWAVVVPLWTVEEGRSDLSLELTVSQGHDNDYAIAIDGLHVL